MWTTLRAFAWLRWRVFVNSLERTGSRDVLERFSLAIEKLGPLLAAVLMIPSAVLLAALGGAAGYLVATGGSALPFTVVRYLLMTVPVLALIGPLFLPAADRTNPIRLLLLPIPRASLYVAQASSAFADPWTLLLVPLVAALPLGLLAGGAWFGGLAATAGAGLLVLVIVGLSALATSLLHLVARDRRRGELAALVFVMLIPVVAILPGLLGDQLERSAGGPDAALLPAWAAGAASGVFSLYPTELFVSATREAADGDAGATLPLAGLAAIALVLHGVGFVVFQRVLDSPGTSGGRRAVPMRAAWTRRLPGLSTGASAVALAHVRLAFRSTRGRSILLSPLAMFAIFALLMYRGAGQVDFGPFRFGSGLGLAGFTAFLSLLSILPIAMNQFAVDKAGLTMTLLSPLSVGDLLAGKAVGNALVGGLPALVSIVVTALVFPGGSPALWLTLLLSLVAVYLVMAPVAAMASAVFPRAVDLNSIGRGSNAHGAAALLGLLAFLLGGVPPAALTLVAIGLLERPAWAPLLVGGWTLAAYGIARLLFIPARRLFESRRENLGRLA